MKVLRSLAPLLLASSLLAQEGPNVLLITCEDLSPHLGCYGDPDAHTPNLDALRKQGALFTHAFAPCPICAPTRSSIITGTSAVSLGTHPMRSKGRRPRSVPCFPQLLRRAGVYCTNKSKTDYNFRVPKGTWQRGRGWAKRKPGQRFFAVFNLMVSHEGKVRAAPKKFAKLTSAVKKEQRQDPAKVKLPPYHPNTKEARNDWARYHDMATAMDAQVGGILRRLKEDGLADNTIVIFASDHGTGMPRHKGNLYDSGTRVPMLVRVPKRWQEAYGIKPGDTSDRIVSLHDLAPTILWAFGVKAPAHMDGVRFLGKDAPERKFFYGFRDRRGERFDFSRAVRGKRFLYIRHFHPNVPRAQWHTYSEANPTLQSWRREYAAGKLNAAQARYLQPSKPREELYDTAADPHNLNNLVGKAEHAERLQSMRQELRRWMLQVHDLGLFPEENMRLRFQEPEYDGVRKLDWAKLGADLWNASNLVGRDAQHLPAMQKAIAHAYAAVRYWGLTALAALGDKATPALPQVCKLLQDSAPSVYLAAASAMHSLGHGKETMGVVRQGLEHDHHIVRMRAADLADRMDAEGRPLMERLRRMMKDKHKGVRQIVTKALADLEGE